MTFIDLQKHVSELSVDEQDKLSAYLTMLRKSRDPEWVDEMASRLGDRSSNSWTSPEGIESGD